MSISNKIAKLYARRPDLGAKEGLYYWETITPGNYHGGHVTDLDSNDIYVDCEFCHKECGTELRDYDLLIPIFREHGFLLPDQLAEDASVGVGMSGNFSGFAPENMVGLNGLGLKSSDDPMDNAYANSKKLHESTKLKTDDPEFMKIFNKIYHQDGHYHLKDLPGFPKELDLENCDMVYVGDDYLQFRAGGDWQDPVTFSFAVVDGEPRIVGLFDGSPSRSHSKEVKAYNKTVKELFDESARLVEMLDATLDDVELTIIDEDEYPRTKKVEFIHGDVEIIIELYLNPVSHIISVEFYDSKMDARSDMYDMIKRSDFSIVGKLFTVIKQELFIFIKELAEIDATVHGITFSCKTQEKGKLSLYRRFMKMIGDKIPGSETKEAFGIPKYTAFWITFPDNDVIYNLEEKTKRKHPRWETLEKHKTPLDKEEAKKVRAAGAIWNFYGLDGKRHPELAVWKSIVKGETYYICNTHRACHIDDTLSGAIDSWPFIESTA